VGDDFFREEWDGIDQDLNIKIFTCYSRDQVRHTSMRFLPAAEFLFSNSTKNKAIITKLSDN